MNISDSLVVQAIQGCSKRLGGKFVYDPRTIQEKIAHIKVLGATELMTACADKILVKEYAKEVLGTDVCVPTIRVYGSPRDIRFSDLPGKFVLKCNHGCHYNIIVRDKRLLNPAEAVRSLEGWLAENYGSRHGELQYCAIRRRCFAEEYVGGMDDTADYKFVCFNGKPTYCQVIRYRGTKRQHLNWYDMDFGFVDISRTDFVSNRNDLDAKPASFDTMKEYARKLSAPFDFVRVDFFEHDGRPYLGELTFTPANATQKYVGDPEVGLMLGSMLRLTK